MMEIKNFVTFVNFIFRHKRRFFLISSFVENIKLRISTTKVARDENQNEQKLVWLRKTLPGLLRTKNRRSKTKNEKLKLLEELNEKEILQSITKKYSATP